MSSDASVFEPGPAWDRAPAFTTVRRGYDPAQVLTFVKQARERVLALETQLGQVERERDELRRDRDVALESWDSAKSDPYEAMSGRLADLMRNFDAEVERLRTDAQAESDRMLAEARAESERILENAQGADEQARSQSEQVLIEAQQQAERIVQTARQEADQIESDLFAVYGTTVNELRSIREHMQKTVDEIDVVLEARPDQRVVVLEEREEAAREEPTAPEAPAPHDSPSEYGR